jgi:hypothetical protein
MATLAHAHNGDTPFAIKHRLHGICERLTQAGRQILQGPGLDLQGFASDVYGAGGVECRGLAHGRQYIDAGTGFSPQAQQRGRESIVNAVVNAIVNALGSQHAKHQCRRRPLQALRAGDAGIHQPAFLF